MTLFLRVVVAWVAVFGIMIVHFDHTGRIVTLNFPGAVLIPAGGQAFELPPLTPPAYFEFRGFDNIRLAENGVPLGESHSLSILRTQGHGAYELLGGHIYLSSRDGSDPGHNGKIYSATLRVYVTDRTNLIALLSVPMLFLFFELIFLAMQRLRSKASGRVWRGSSLPPGIGSADRAG